MRNAPLRILSFFLVWTMLPILPSCKPAFDPVPDAVRGELPVLMKDTYQAEDAALTKATVGNTLDDFTGSGYLTDASDISFSVKTDAAATYGITLRYTNASGTEAEAAVSVNGGEAETFTLPVTPSETTWCDKLITVPLAEGDNTVAFSLKNGICLDKIDVCRAYQAEDGGIMGGAKKLKAYKGYTGTGYVGLFEKGHGVQFTVFAPVTGSYEVTLRYSASQTDSNPRSLTVDLNNTFSEQLFLSSTRAGTNWGVYRYTLEMPAGENTLSLYVGDGDDGQFSLDLITVKPTNWTYAGKVVSVTGDRTSRVDFTLDNAVLRFDSVAENTVRVWLDPDGRFTRKYASAAVANEAVDPQKLTV